MPTPRSGSEKLAKIRVDVYRALGSLSSAAMELEFRQSEYDSVLPPAKEALRKARGGQIRVRGHAAMIIKWAGAYVGRYEEPQEVPAGEYVVGVVQKERVRETTPEFDVVWLLPTDETAGVEAYGALIDKLQPASLAEIRAVNRARQSD